MKKFIFSIVLVLLSLSLTSCGGKGSSSHSMSDQYKVAPYYDINNPSTLNLDELKNLPKVINLKDKMTSVKNQNDRGTCSFFSVIALVESAIKTKMNIDVNLSEEFLSYITKSTGYSSDDEGNYVDDNLKVAITKKGGFLLEREMPYEPSWFAKGAPCENYSDTDKNAPKKCYIHKSPSTKILKKIISSEDFSILVLNADSTNDIINALAEFKKPMSIILPVNNQGWVNSGDVTYTEEMRSHCIKNPKDCGTHAVALTGYDLEKKVFFFKNSWSTEWGHEGYGTIPFDVVDKHVEPQFFAIDLKKDIALPPDYEKEDFKLDAFYAVPRIEADSRIRVNSFGGLSNVGTRTIKVVTKMVLMSLSNKELPNEKNTSEVVISNGTQKNYISAEKTFFNQDELMEMSWKSEDPLVLEIGSEDLMNSSVSQLLSMNSTTSKFFMKTTISVYTDDSKYKELKNIYQPIN